jgi:hypothetical protein
MRARTYAAGGHAQGDSFTSVENVAGSSFHDRIAGDAGANKLFGGDRDDCLRGEAGNDELFGGSGGDLFAFADGDGDDEIGDFVVRTDFWFSAASRSTARSSSTATTTPRPTRWSPSTAATRCCSQASRASRTPAT